MAGEIIIPFIGISFTIASIVVAAVALLIGYVIGNSAKGTLKAVLAIVGFVLLLFLTGLIPRDVADKLKEIFLFLQPLISGMTSSITSASGTGGIPTIVLAFVVGIILGWWRS